MNSLSLHGHCWVRGGGEAWGDSEPPTPLQSIHPLAAFDLKTRAAAA